MEEGSSLPINGLITFNRPLSGTTNAHNAPNETKTMNAYTSKHETITTPTTTLQASINALIEAQAKASSYTKAELVAIIDNLPTVSTLTTVEELRGVEVTTTTCSFYTAINDVVLPATQGHNATSYGVKQKLADYYAKVAVSDGLELVKEAIATGIKVWSLGFWTKSKYDKHLNSSTASKSDKSGKLDSFNARLADMIIATFPTDAQSTAKGMPQAKLLESYKANFSDKYEAMKVELEAKMKAEADAVAKEEAGKLDALMSMLAGGTEEKTSEGEGES